MIFGNEGTLNKTTYKTKKEALVVPGSGAESDYDFIPRKLSEAESRADAENKLAEIVNATEGRPAKQVAQEIGDAFIAEKFPRVVPLGDAEGADGRDEYQQRAA